MTFLAARLALTLRSRSRVFQAIKTSTSSRLLEVEKPPRLSALPPTALDCLHRTSPSQRGTRSAEQDTALSWSETFVAAIDRNRKKKRPRGPNRTLLHVAPPTPAIELGTIRSAPSL
jgi:hypothetical protein